MTNKDQRPILDKQDELVRYEAFIVRILEKLKNEPARSKPSWLRFLESSGGTALITVLIGGILGAVISGIFQSGAKDREFQQLWLKARGDQAMVAYKDFVEKREEKVKDLFARLGKYQSVATDYIKLSTDRYQVTKYPVEKRPAVQKERDVIKQRYDDAKLEWSTEQESFGSFMIYYYPTKDPTSATSAQKSMERSWNDFNTSLNTYLNCPEVWIENNPIEENNANACSSERVALVKATNQLNITLEQNRSYLWKGWESPEKLREVLNNK